MLKATMRSRTSGEFFPSPDAAVAEYRTQVAHEMWKLFPGPWEVPSDGDAITSAQHFGLRHLATFVGEAIEPVQIETWTFFSFESLG